MNSTTAVILMLAVVLVAVIPGFKIIWFFNEFIPVLPPEPSIIQYLYYLVVLSVVIIFDIAANTVYADFAIPLVTHIFARILHQSARESASVRISQGATSEH
ncbi:hypothetical protein GCK32_012121 [Trichostrongylus colubriformis]|uniref:Uncharacterized protein n=1 Tax=Trichostrongylus colubriformis TaxID=6319 RepID=A0AAN8IFR4_TRICO